MSVVILSMVIALTEPTHLVKHSNMYVNYTQGKVSANVDITRYDTRLFYLDDGTATSSKDIGEEHEYMIPLNATNNKSHSINLGEFNPGQALDKTRADSELIIDIKLLNGSNDTTIKLQYTDTEDKDSNIRLVVSAVMYRGNKESDVETYNYDMFNGVWQMQDGVIFQTTNNLTNKSGTNNYNSSRITIKAELVSYADNCRLDGTFNLSLTA